MWQRYSILGLLLIAPIGGYFVRFGSAGYDKPPTSLADDHFFRAVLHPLVWRNGVSSPILLTIPVANTSGKTVVFGALTCDCGCTTGGLGANTLAPGKSTKLTMAVNGQGRHGPQRFTCHWPDGDGNTWTAEAQTTIYQPARFDPSVLHFGHRYKPADRVVRTIWLEEYSERQDDLVGSPAFTLRGQGLAVQVGETSAEPLPGGCFRLRTPVEVAQEIPRETGYGSGTVSFAGRGSPAANGVTMSADWTVRDAVEVAPRQLAFLFVPGNPDRSERVVVIKGPAGSPFGFTGLATSGSVISAERQVGVDAPNELRVKISVRLTPGQSLLAGWVAVRLMLPEPTEVRIPVTALRAGG